MKPSISVRNVSLCPFVANAGFRDIDFGFTHFEEHNELTISQVHLTFYPGHFKPIGNGTFNFETHCSNDISDKQKEKFYKNAYQQYLKIKNQTVDR